MYRKLYKTESSTKEINIFEVMKVSHLALESKTDSNYSPTAIIRNAKIWNIILLLAFSRTLSSNLDLEYPAVSEENCLKNLLPLP